MSGSYLWPEIAETVDLAQMGAVCRVTRIRGPDMNCRCYSVRKIQVRSSSSVRRMVRTQ
jgi:hypothetical protein